MSCRVVVVESAPRAAPCGQVDPRLFLHIPPTLLVQQKCVEGSQGVREHPYDSSYFPFFLPAALKDGTKADMLGNLL